MFLKKRYNSSTYFISLFCAWCFLLTLPLAAQERFRRDVPDPDPLPLFNLQDIESSTLSNGLGLFVIRQDKTPVIHLRLIIADGENSSPTNLPGMATFTANMLNRGAASLSSVQIEEAIESMGGDFSSIVYPDFTLFSFSFLEEYLDEALEVLSKMFLQPTFLKLEIENVKRTMKYDLLQKMTDPEFLANKILNQILFREHPYRNIAFNADVIKNYNRETLLIYFDTYYRPNNTQILLIGNLNIGTATRKVSQNFNQWQKKDIEKKRILSPQPNGTIKICFVDLPRAKDATIYMGNILSTEVKDNMFPFFVFNQVLGGTTNSRLFMNLRESKGFAYWTFSEVEFFNLFGLAIIRAKVQHESIYSSVIEIITEIQNTVQNKIPNNEIEQAKSYLIGNFPLTINTMEQFALRISKKIVFNQGDELWNNYYENLSFVNSDDVFKTVNKTSLLTPVIVIVGDKEKLSKYLNSFEEVEFYDHNGVFLSKIEKEDTQ